MAFPQHHFQQQYQPQQQQQPKSLRNLYSIYGQVSPPVNYYEQTNVLDQSQHPPYVPPFHVVGFAPGPAPAADCSDTGAELRWNYGVESKKKRLKEQDFMENNSQISSIDFLHPRSVSTGLGLSLDNTRIASTGDSALLSLIRDDVDRELQQQDVEMDRFLKIQGERVRQKIVEKVQAREVEMMWAMEERVMEKVREKEEEAESMNERNRELEERVRRLSAEAGAWQQRARLNETMISALKSNLQHVYSDTNEGCGDTASSCFDFLGPSPAPPIMTCKACHVNEVSMLLLPCKHLCLCKTCEPKLTACPICHSSKFIGMEVYM